MDSACRIFDIGAQLHSVNSLSTFTGTRKCEQIISDHESNKALWVCVFNHDAQRLLTAGDDCTIRIYERDVESVESELANGIPMEQ